MAALTPLQRRYVLAMACDPFGTPSEWAAAAGYKVTPNGNERVQGHYLAHNPKIEKAIFEVSRSMMDREGPILAAAGLIRIARDKDHPKNLQALDSLADRVGLPRTTEHRVDVNHTDRSGSALMKRLEVLAAKYGLDAAMLLAGNVKQIEAKAVEVVDVGLQGGPIREGERPERGEHVPQRRNSSDGASTADSH